MWSVRRKALGSPELAETSAGQPAGPKFLVLPVNKTRKPNFVRRMLGLGDRNEELVAILTCPHLFSQLEQEQDAICDQLKESRAGPSKDYHGFDKPDTRGKDPRPLTRCTHDEWTRQRELVKRAFSNLPHRSLEATKRLLLEDVLKISSTDEANGVLLVDWKQVAVTVAVQWVVHLFRGRKDALMEDRLIEVWKASRSPDIVSPSEMKAKRQDLSKLLVPVPDELKTSTPEGVLDSLFTCGISFSEAQDNAINAMIAAMDATQSLMFWTMWNLSRSGYWKQARALVSSNKIADILKSDLKHLGVFKVASTKGKQVDYSQLSFLGRALCETVRVFPPVWTLPRTWPRESQLVDIQPNTRWSKLDVAIVNGAGSPQDWDPNNVRPSYISSFGLGRRHCPAGTAALHATYVLLFEFISKFTEFEEDVPDQAMSCTCLLPTLSVLGPQYFRAKRVA